ncbi:transporter substrate-binding domain-containing protein [Mesobacterium pallidum]|uniref:transporter substrate-binding domain-containing protein n=1 Tax=Mesobacterium pallidum TaxID=2872037 RepID=UPI001EE23E00|nr:transporter substrate-binding domain-containing protein [Mesobacterium pallidum]
MMRPGPFALILALALATPGGAADGPGAGGDAARATLDAAGQDSCRAQGKKLCVGVRSHSRPFSYRSERMIDVATHAALGPLGRDRYTGYVIKICDAVLTEMVSADPELGIDDIGVFDIDEARRNGRAAGGDIRFTGLGAEFDILCDPATITNERRVDLVVSAPIYLTGISYITPRDFGPPQSACGTRGLIGMVGQTTAQSYGLSALIEAQELPAYKSVLVATQRGTVVCAQEGDPYEELQAALDKVVAETAAAARVAAGKDEATEEAPEPTAPANLAQLPDIRPVRIYDSHDAAARDFCSKQFHYYLGDREIIREQADAIPGCEFDGGVETYTEDRYAIFGKAMQDVAVCSRVSKWQARALAVLTPSAFESLAAAFGTEGKATCEAGAAIDIERRLRVASFFEILARKTLGYPSLLDQAYEETFQDTPKSDKLKTFFRNVRGTPRNR